jgi:predicted alpha/beta superfamily hydrolase
MPRKPAPPAQTPVTIPGAVQFDMASQISGRTYRIFVATPILPPPPSGYPVVVVSDGNLMFPIATAVNVTFALGGRQALVVGVGYPADDMMTPMVMRTRDLTPPTPLERVEQGPGLPPATAESIGGAQEFHRFLVEELRPAIAAAYPVDADNQTLYGHSLGGLFTLHALFKHPTSWRAFVASSPSIWWNRRAVLKDEAWFARQVAAGKAAPRVLIMIGGQEQDPPTEPMGGATLAQTRKLLRRARMVDNAAELGARLSDLQGGAGYEAHYQAFEAEDHMSVVAASIARALALALRP